MDWGMDLLTTSPRDSELQLQHYRWSPHFTDHYMLSLLQVCCICNSCSLVTAPCSGDSSAFRAHVVNVPANIPHLNSQPAWVPRYTAPGGPNRKHRLQQYPYCCYGRLPSHSLGIVDVFTGLYQATRVLSRDRYTCIATVLQATIYP
jgi:hypothetical protein